MPEFNFTAEWFTASNCWTGDLLRGSKCKRKTLEKPEKGAVEIAVETLQGFDLLYSILRRCVPGLLPCCHEYLPACEGGFAEWASPQAEAPLVGADLLEVHQCSIVRTADARDYLLFDLTCLVRGKEVSFCAGEAHSATRPLAGVLRCLSGIGPIPRDSGDKAHPRVMFVTKRLQTVS